MYIEKGLKIGGTYATQIFQTSHNIGIISFTDISILREGKSSNFWGYYYPPFTK